MSQDNMAIVLLYLEPKRSKGISWTRWERGASPAAGPCSARGSPTSWGAIQRCSPGSWAGHPAVPGGSLSPLQEDVMLLPAEVSQPHSHVTQEPRGTTRCAEKLSAVHHFAQDVLKSGRGPDFQQKSVLPLWAVKYLGGRLCFASCLSLRAE